MDYFVFRYYVYEASGGADDFIGLAHSPAEAEALLIEPFSSDERAQIAVVNPEGKLDIVSIFRQDGLGWRKPYLAHFEKPEYPEDDQPLAPMSPLEEAVGELLESLFVFPANTPHSVHGRVFINSQQIIPLLVSHFDARLVLKIKQMIETARIRAQEATNDVS